MSDNSNVVSIVQRIKLLSKEIQALTEELEGLSGLGATDNSSSKPTVSVEGITWFLRQFLASRNLNLPRTVTFDRLARILRCIWTNPERKALTADEVSKRLTLKPISKDMKFLLKCNLLNRRDDGLYLVTTSCEELMEGL